MSQESGQTISFSILQTSAKQMQLTKAAQNRLSRYNARILISDHCHDWHCPSTNKVNFDFFCFVLMDLFIQLSCIFCAIWRYNVEIS